VVDLGVQLQPLDAHARAVQDCLAHGVTLLQMLLPFVGGKVARDEA
jgi:hypothetical protein